MDDPIQEIVAERERARERGDPLVDVCYLVTVASADRAEARALTLRDVTERGVGVLINRTSPKWRQLSQTETATILIHWPSVRRQYRVWGTSAPMEPERVDAYWRRKNHGSKLLEHYYTDFQPQSGEIASREEFLAGIEALRRRHPDRDAVPAPASLAGVYLVPREIEAWHGSEERLHDRRRYRRSGAGWESTILVP
ncbi:MAG TPA: pyridoxine 5'-phosphate oxidase C-terminal domain-containing protein [bacterium]|nr:pyridoxine 5'-phosphate oxidase C-terminal domain-containing protein [bacterium]